MAALSRSTPRIFISHSHVDNEFGIKLVNDLRLRLGDEKAVWYDIRGGLVGGDVWWEKIMKALETCQMFIVLLSPDAMKSRFVRTEINIASQRTRILILPVLYRPCKVRADLKTRQIISFLPPKSYEEAFRELLTALKLSSKVDTSRLTSNLMNSEVNSTQQTISRIELAFNIEDWSYVIEKVNDLISQCPEVVSPSLYHMLGLAYLYKGLPHRAQDILGKALTLVKEPEQRLTLLDEYTGPSVSQNQWTEVLLRANEALELAPHGTIWKMAQEEALARVDQKEHVLTTSFYNTDNQRNLNGVSKSQVKPKEAKVRQSEVMMQSAHRGTEQDRAIEGQYAELEMKKALLEMEYISSAIKMGDLIAEKFYPNSDTKAKAALARTFLQNFLQFGMSKAVELALPETQDMPEETSNENI